MDNHFLKEREISMKVKSKLTKLEKSWILYDIGNSAFILMVSTLIPIFFNSLADAAGVNEDLYLSYWGYAGSISTILVAFIEALTSLLPMGGSYLSCGLITASPMILLSSKSIFFFAIAFLFYLFMISSVKAR